MILELLHFIHSHNTASRRSELPMSPHCDDCTRVASVFTIEIGDEVEVRSLDDREEGVEES